MRNVRLLVLGACAAALVCAADQTAVCDQGPDGKYTINWTAGLVTATGSGPLQEKYHGKRNRVIQRRVAVVDAYRQLAEAVAGVKITAETTVKEFQLADDTIRTQVDGFLRGMQVVRERWGEDDVYEVTVVAPLFGANGKGLASVVLPAYQGQDPEAIRQTAEQCAEKKNKTRAEDQQIALPARAVEKVDIPATKPEPPTPVPTCQPGPNGKYTGVVVDARGFHLERAMSPRIVDKDATPLFGKVTVSREFVLDTGIVSYVPTMDMALNPNQSRAGQYPLVLRAIGREGSFRANAVLSDADVATLKAENDKAKFLDSFKVVFVVD